MWWPLTLAKMAPIATATTSIMLELRKYLMLMAILAATVTYIAGLNPPGGVWLHTEDGHLTGDQILIVTGRRRYNAFYYSNAAAFMASVVVILLLLLMERSIGRSNKLLVLATLRVVMVLDFFAVLVAYAAGASRGTATTVIASLLVSAVSIYITGYAAYRTLFRPRAPPESPSDATLNLRLERRRKTLMLFCIFAATVTYTAGLNPPGGFWPDSRAGSHPGSPVLEEDHHTRRFITFFVCNTAAFIASLRGIMLLTTIRSKFRDGDGNGRWWYVLYGHVVVALSGLLVAYGFGSCRETHSTVYVFGLVFPVVAYTGIQFVIQRYCWNKLVDLADKIHR
jgi:hypothetical protein